MSSKRHIKRKACLSKIRYETSQAASEARRSVQKSHKGYGGPMTVYGCEFCGGYHIGHASRKQLNKRRVAMESK